ncbi:MAG: FtsX-like permease family protein [Actinobacteria bacterium]|nr:MAG: FtsX-like permease family protein [Actinomycetota bacterium]
MRFRAELRSGWRTWLILALLAGVAGGVVVAGIAGARRTDSALARHLKAYGFPNATVSLSNGPNSIRAVPRLRGLPLVQASALDAELAYCARDARDRPVIDNGPQAVWFLVSLDGQDGVVLHRPKLLAGRTPDPARPREVLLDSRAARRFSVHPGDVIPIRVFPFFGEGDFGVFRCDPRHQNPYQPGLPTRREVRQILIACPRPQPCDEAKVLIDSLDARLKNGADFATLAKKYSDDPAGKEGGRLWITRGQPVEPFDSTAFRLHTGAISRPLKTVYGWHIVQPLSRLVPGGRLVRLKVVGVKATTDPYPISKVLLTPTFNRVYGFDSQYFDRELSVRLRHGAADLPAFREAVLRLGERIGPGDIDAEQDAAAKIERSIHHQAQALRLAAAVGALLAFVLLGQALVRVASFEALKNPTLRALGMTPEQLVAVGVARAAAIALPAAALAAGIAAALSPLSPIGLARELEPHPGFAFDAVPVALGSAAVLVAVLLAGAYASSRAARGPAVAAATPTGRVAPADTLARWGFPATLVSGVRFALARGRGATAVPVGVSVLAGVLAVSVVAIALTFTASLDHLFSTPRLYGQNWDYRSNYAVPTAATVRADRSLSDVANGGINDSVLLNGRQVGVVDMDDVKGRIAPVVTQGRAPERPDEILLAPKTLDALGLHVGDTVEARVKRSRQMRIVGQGVVPEGTFNELGKGAALTFQAYRQLDPGVQPYSFEARIAPGADRNATLARLERRYVTPAPGPPKTVADFGGVSELPLVVSGLLVAIAAAVLAHALVMAVRHRRRQLAVLKTLGFDRRQVLATIAWQATTLAVLALVVGLPLGVSLGRWAWTLFAEQIGVVPEPVTPLPLILLVVPAALALANLVALLPARNAARTPAALVLRAE